MTELRIEKPTLIAKVEGTVFVMDADGAQRPATPGMQLEPGTRLVSGSNGHVELVEAGGERPEPAQPEAALPAGADAELASWRACRRPSVRGPTQPSCLQRRPPVIRARAPLAVWSAPAPAVSWW
ncbi:hypothetical protein WP8S18E04_21840 [Aeromonas caviae]|nr:hypothetical protein WP8S18E04_21840 [Aeromonas caviae]